MLTDYDSTGRRSMRIQAERIDQIDHGTEVALSNVRVDYQSPSGQSWVLFGDTAHVEARRQDRRRQPAMCGSKEQSNEHAGAAVIHTDTLSYDVPNSIATTKSDVRIDFGAHTLTARGLVANLKERTMRLESKVNGRFQP